jgi:hypothetical protein
MAFDQDRTERPAASQSSSGSAFSGLYFEGTTTI